MSYEWPTRRDDRAALDSRQPPSPRRTFSLRDRLGMDIDLKQLMNFLAVARHGSFGRAAVDLRISQPALSNSIAQLERRIGEGRILDRGRHGASLTELGNVLFRHAEMLEVQLGRLTAEVDHYKASTDGPLLIAVTPVAVAHLVPQAMGRLLNETPAIAASIFETVYGQAVPALLKGSIDLMVGPVGVYPPVEGLHEEPLVVDPFAVVVRSKHPLASRRSISLKQLAGARWVLPNEDSAYRRQLEALFMVAGVPWPTQCVSTNSMAALKAMVVNTDCIALLPLQLISVEKRAGLLNSVRLAEAGASRSVGLSWAKDRTLSALAMRFVEAIRACANEKAARNSAR
jgi:LysR family transcriptional regulator of gallate degradation